MKYAENNMLYKLKFPDIEYYEFNMKGNETGFYWYEHQNKEYQMTFYSESDSYRVKIY
ncbi:MAG: hypothetical protein K2G83_04375 [Ruminococcus sp.]|nr:hypothetical protein [Ruminococcus sp.]